MNCVTSFSSKTILSLIVAILFASTAYANEFVGVSCVDITTTQGTHRVLELAVSSVNEKYYALNGTHRDTNGNTVGLAVGSALTVGNKLLVTVNASTAVGSTMQSTVYQFDLNNSTWTGTFQSTTQKGIGGSFSTNEYRSGTAAIPSSCDDLPISVEPPVTSECVPTGNEVCGDNVDNDCNGMVDDFFLCYEPSEPSEPTEPEPTEPEPTEPVVVYPSFTDNGNGTLTQSGTRLMWQQEDLDPKDIGRDLINWYSGADYCDDLTFAGHSNWRLPTLNELQGILDDRYSPTINPLFTNTEKLNYWTSTETSQYSANDVHFGTGATGKRPKQNTYDIVRCVRSF